MEIIDPQLGIFHDVAEQLREEYQNRKASSRKYSNINTIYFQSLMVEAQNCSEERKEEIEGIFKRAQKQQKCALNIQHILASGKDHQGDIKTDSKLLDIKTCSCKKTCSICSAAVGRNMIIKLLSYFAENKDIVAYPFTISPRNYEGETMRERVRAAHFGTENIYKNFKEGTKKREGGPTRGSAPSRKAIDQLKESMTACYFTKEFEPGNYDAAVTRYLTEVSSQVPEEERTSEKVSFHFDEAHKAGMKNKETVNAHWHGIIFMKKNESGSYKDLLDYGSFRSFIEWCNGGDKCQVEIGNTRNGNKPITYSDLYDDDGNLNSNKSVKAFLEVTKYITKMSVKDDDEDFDLRQELIWEVSAATYRYNFVKQGGELVKYKPPQKIDFWQPQELKHHGLVYERKTYKQYIHDVDQDYISTCWFQTIRLEYVEFLKEDLEQRLNMMECSKKIKSAKTQLKGYNTEIQTLKAIIQYHTEPGGKKSRRNYGSTI